MVRLPPRLRPLFPHLKRVYVRGTRAVAPSAQWLSRRGGGWLPTAFVDTLAEAAVRSGGRYVVARPGEEVVRVPARGLPEGLPMTDSRTASFIERVVVAELPRGRVLGPHHAVISGAGDLVDEVSRYFVTTHASQHPLFLNPFPPPPVEIDGRLGVLATRGDSNYFHFLTEVVPRLGVLGQAPGVSPPDRWYVPTTTRFQRELLQLLSIPPELIVDAGRHQHVRAECLVVPSFAGMIETQANPHWVMNFLRERLLAPAGVDPAPTPHRRIFVTRGLSANNRSVRNEPAVVAMLAERGFETVDPGRLSAVDQIRTFAEAALIVAPHGAALTNLVFASPGAAVVELFPAGSRLPEFWRIACAVPGLRYRYLSAPAGRNRQTRQSAIVRDIEVDTTLLAELLDELE